MSRVWSLPNLHSPARRIAWCCLGGCPRCTGAQGGLERERCWMEHLGRLALAIHVKRQAQLYPPEAGLIPRQARMLNVLEPLP